MRSFHYREGELCCEKVPVAEIASKVGTPLYVYSWSTLVSNFERVREAFSALDPLICYSLKANANLTICRVLASYGAGADIVSGGELYQALKAGFPPGRIVYAGVGKTPDEIKYALKEKIFLFNVESESELMRIAKIASELGKRAGISVRVNLDVDPKTHQYITTGKKENKFGLSLPQAENLYQKMARMESIEVKGIHAHIGSQITDTEPYLEMIRRLSEFIRRITEKGINLQYLNIGGGFGIGYKETEEEFPIEKLSEGIASLVPENMKLILEPGRYIVGSAGVLLTRILYRKEGKEKKFLIVDTGMNDLVRPSLYQAYHRIIPARSSSQDSFEEVDVVGPVCESGDFFAKKRELPPLKEEELLAILDTGAYGFSMSSNYNGRRRPAEVLVKNERWWLIREREELDDLIKGQRVPTDASVYREKPSSASSLLYFNFWKMEGSSNDFILIDNRDGLIRERSELARWICQRTKGVGADGLILIEASEDADFTMRIFNPDGSEAEMCGNGARCAARFAFLKEIASRRCVFQTLAGKIEAQVNGENVKIKMSNPSNLREEVVLDIEDNKLKGYFIDTGVPHFVIFYEDIEKVPILKLGPEVRSHQFFHPRGTNVDFVKIGKEKILTRTYERGVENETLGCGTGAVASALISSLVYGISSPVDVWMRGGRVRIWFERQGKKFNNVFMEGKVNIMYKGYLNGGELCLKDVL